MKYLTLIALLWSFSSWGANPLLAMTTEPSVTQLQAWINDGANVNEKTSDGQTPLIIAAKNKWHRTVQILMDNKAHANTTDKNGNTALHHTAYNDDLPTARIILTHQKMAHQGEHSLTERFIESFSKRFESNYIDINAYNKDHKTIFMIAVQKGFLQYAQMLTSYKVNIEAKDLQKQTPLFYAVQNEDLPMVQYLIEQGANVRAKDKSNNMVIHLAIRLQLHSIVDVLAIEGHSPLNESNAEFLPPLHTAIMALDVKMIQTLLHAGAEVDNIHTGEKYKVPPLALLFIMPDLTEDNILEIAKLFINKKANVNTTAHSPIEKNTLLHIAIDKNYEKVVDLLLSAKVKLNVFNAEGRSPLLLAIEQKKPNMVQKLLSAGADANQKPNDIFYFYPLHLAVYNDLTEITNLLLNGNASIKIKDANGNTALNKALEKPFFSTYSTTNNDTVQIIQQLLLAGADPDTQNNEKYTPAMKAVMRNNFQALELLANRGANFTLTDHKGKTVYDHLEDIKRLYPKRDVSQVDKILSNCERGFKQPA